MSSSTVKNSRPRPVVLCILDGWGERDERQDNAVALAQTPNWDRLKNSRPSARLCASGSHVGLPDKQMGNSEVGHMNLGAGRIVMQDLPRIDAAVADGTLAANPSLTNLVETLKKTGGVCHVMGLLSPGGVHSHQDHMAELVRIVAEGGAPVAIHAFLDGRDTPPKSAMDCIRRFMGAIGGLADVRFATVSGRYYAMDRDSRWDRVEKAYRAIHEAEGKNAPDPISAVKRNYNKGVTDEFVPPTVIADYAGVRDGDALLMVNFRSDRVREILTALVEPDFHGFPRSRFIDFSARVGLAEYSTDLSEYLDILFPPPRLSNILGQVVSEAGLKQLRIAETEKYAHVTFFFNAGREEVYPGEERILVPSPKVATYDLKPEMSAHEVTDRLVEAIGSGTYDLIVVNFANGDMVGHTGILDAAIKATEAVDKCLGWLEEAVVDAGGAMLITADHGNCELMADRESNQPHTAHTLSPVPVVFVGRSHVSLHDGRLADVAPTLLGLLGLPIPEEMTGHSLMEKDGAHIVAAQ